MPSKLLGAKDTSGGLVSVYEHLHANAIAPATWRQQARIFLVQGEADRCRLILETLLHTAPDDVAAHLLLGEAALAGGPASYDEAVAACRRAHQLTDSLDPIVRAHAACAMGVALGHKARSPWLKPEHRAEVRETAMAFLESGLSQCTNQPINGGGDGAIQGSDAPPEQIAQLRAYLSYNLAVVAAELGMLGPALRHAHTALAAADKLPSDGESLLVACVLLVAVLLTARQQLDAALSVLSLLDRPREATTSASSAAAAAVDLDNAPSISSRMLPEQHVLVARVQAGVLTAQGAHASAASVLTHCRKALPTTHRGSPFAAARLWQLLAAACAQAGATADACFCADQALAMEPWSAGSHYVAGLAHECVGRYAPALDSFSAALALEPHHAPSLLKQGALLAKAGTLTQLSAARDMLCEGLRLEPTCAAGWYQLGLACRAMQHHQAAEKHLRTAVLLSASSPVVPFSALPFCYPPEAKDT